MVIRFGHDWDQTCMIFDEVSHVSYDRVTSAARARGSHGERRSHMLSAGPDICRCTAQVLASCSDQMKNFAVVYLVDTSEVPDFNTMYELYDPCTVMFFFRNKVGISFTELTKAGQAS